MLYGYSYDTKIGKIGIVENGEAITNVFFGGSVQPAVFTERETTLLQEAAKQLDEYLDGKRTTFDLPYAPVGTPFEQSVWTALLTIPYGEVRSYKEIAEQIGRPTSCRAVGRANGRNPIGIFIPCHRVIGSDGSLTGYAGGLEMKSQLLALEKRQAWLS